jgi:UDP-N-acetylglucosamine 2-epimerase
MSQLFFDEMDIPEPDMNLGIGSGLHGEQTGKMLVALETVFKNEQPDWVMVFGDTNSTLAASLAAVKLAIPIAHIEAGLRSFNRRMPEEINRVLTDKISSLLFCPTEKAVENLKNEGIINGVYQTGDVMYDAAVHFGNLSDKNASVLKRLNLKTKTYVLATCHRPQNTDCRNNLTNIVKAMIASNYPVVFAVHPRTRHFLNRYQLWPLILKARKIYPIEPVGYLDMIQLEKNAAKILTDSGGIQKEGYFFSVPCITLRDETEWTETVDDGWNILVGSHFDRILDALNHFSPSHTKRDHYGDGQASEKIARILGDI